MKKYIFIIILFLSIKVYSETKIILGINKFYTLGVNTEVAYSLTKNIEIYLGEYFWYNFEKKLLGKRTYLGSRYFINLNKILSDYIKIKLPKQNNIFYYFSYDYPDGIGSGFLYKYKSKTQNISSYIGLIDSFSNYYFRVGYSL